MLIMTVLIRDHCTVLLFHKLVGDGKESPGKKLFLLSRESEDTMDMASFEFGYEIASCARCFFLDEELDKTLWCVVCICHFNQG